MGVPAALAELLACPSCGTRLAGNGCLACRVDYPAIGGIPWLMPEPRFALNEWRGRLHLGNGERVGVPAKFNLEPNRKYSVRVLREPQRITLFVDGRDVLSEAVPEFEAPFARIDFVARDRFNVSYHRHTGQWFRLYQDVTLDEALRLIGDGMHFQPC